jgi:hypothetical protein
MLAAAHPNVDVRHEIYPKYRTTGELGECTAAFVRWVRRRVEALEAGCDDAGSMFSASVGGDVGGEGAEAGSFVTGASGSEHNGEDGSDATTPTMSTLEKGKGRPADVKVILLGHS